MFKIALRRTHNLQIRSFSSEFKNYFRITSEIENAKVKNDKKLRINIRKFSFAYVWIGGVILGGKPLTVLFKSYVLRLGFNKNK